jgi:glycosyltransferase involved in cell wall biosynthesis
MPPPSISVVIPAYNEEARLGPTVAAVCAYLETRGGEWEVILVDDGSKDRTVEVAKGAAGARPRVRVTELFGNRGKGAAVRAGVLAATSERVLFSDADLATPIGELARLEARLDEGYDIAIASRALPGSDIRTRQHRAREWMGRVFNALVRAVLIGGVRDTQCGFKLFSRAAARDLFGRASIDGFAFDVEILWLARGSYRIAEVPVVWRHVEESKVSPGLDAARMFIDLLRLRLRRRPGRRASP